jgi:GDP-L-fucose synthase
MVNILLLGATGFVGKNFVNKLEQDINVSLTQSSKSLDCDLRDSNQTIALISKSKPDLIINCAAHVGSLHYVSANALTIIEDNSRMILNLYEAVAKINKEIVIINPIANCAFPSKVDIFKEDEWFDGHLHETVMPYGTTRRLIWSVGECARRQHNINSIYLFVPNMYGPFDSTDPNKTHALNALALKFVKSNFSDEREIEVWGTGIAIREWLYVKDFVNFVAKLIEKDTYRNYLNETVNIAQNFGLSVKDLVEIITSKFENDFSVNWDSSKPDGANKKVMDNSKFLKLFPEFKFTDFNIGLQETIEYYKSIYPY